MIAMRLFSSGHNAIPEAVKPSPVDNKMEHHASPRLVTPSTLSSPVTNFPKATHGMKDDGLSNGNALARKVQLGVCYQSQS